jgi:RimJ/RimL family protein N-acetyltransferase
MARFVQGKVIRRFTLRGRKVVFRYPRMSDLKDTIRHVNSLVEERACIAIQSRKTPVQERKYMGDIFRKMRDGDQIMLCAEVDGKFAGSSGIARNKGDARRHVVTLGIALGRDYRNMGIGTELMKTMEALARKEMGARIVQLSCFEGNLRSRHVYEKLGYREAGRIPKGISHYGKYMDEILMVKRLK